jgi:hypothetical protein
MQRDSHIPLQLQAKRQCAPSVSFVALLRIGLLGALFTLRLMCRLPARVQ